MERIPMQNFPLNQCGSGSVAVAVYTQRWIYFWKWNQECEMSVFTLHFIHFLNLNFKFIFCSRLKRALTLLSECSHFSIPAIKRLFFHIKHRILRSCCCWTLLHTHSYPWFSQLSRSMHAFKNLLVSNFQYPKLSTSFVSTRMRMNMIEILRVKRLHLFMCTFSSPLPPPFTHVLIWMRFILLVAACQHKTRWHDTTRIIPTKGFRCWNEI